MNTQNAQSQSTQVANPQNATVMTKFQEIVTNLYAKAVPEKALNVLAEIISTGALPDLKTDKFDVFSIADALDKTENPKAFGGSLASLKRRLNDATADVHIAGEKPNVYLYIHEDLFNDAFDFAEALGFPFDTTDDEVAEDDPDYLAMTAEDVEGDAEAPESDATEDAE